MIEAAWFASNRAPGLTRSFAMEEWAATDKKSCSAIRSDARKNHQPGTPFDIRGSDISPEALALCEKHLRQANLMDKIHISQLDVKDVRLRETGVCFLTNPPYGERLGDKKQAAQIARALGSLLAASPGASLCALTADHDFESQAKLRANKRRRLYNGRLECEFLIFEPK